MKKKTKTSEEEIALTEQLRRAADAYYGSGEAIMTDANYDELLERLRSINPKSKFFEQVGAAPDSDAFKKVRLVSHMGSQLKINTTEEARAWFDKFETPILVSYKMDGGSVELSYQDGHLMRAATRGDGTIGQDITRNARKWKGVPVTIPLDGHFVVRGEAILPIGAWKEHFPDTANPRNAGNGTMLRQDGTGNQHMHFVAFDCSDVNATHQSSRLATLQSLSFQVVKAQLCRTFDEVRSYYEATEKARDLLFYEIDGLVLAIDDLGIQRMQGFAEGGSKPKGQVAWKFASKGAETFIRGIEVNVGSAGSLAPTAILDPVDVGGVTIERATLNNFEFIREMNLNIGDRVEVTRRNDVIPCIERVVEKNSDGYFEPPAECPACGSSKLERGEKSRVLRCVNPTCGGKQISRIMAWIQKTKIENIGDALLEALTTFPDGSPLVQDIIDLYTLVPHQLENLQSGAGGRLGSSMAAKVVESIHERKKMPIHIMMGSLSIPFLGRRMAQKIGIPTIQGWLDVTEAELAAKDGMGPNKAREMYRGIQEAADRLIRPLQKIIQIENSIPTPPSQMSTNSKLAGMAFVFTGVRPTDSETQRIAELGGTIKDSVSKNSTHLVQKDASKESSKSKKAKDLGQQVMSYVEFQNLIA